jgi:hypothetical protein
MASVAPHVGIGRCYLGQLEYGTWQLWCRLSALLLRECHAASQLPGRCGQSRPHGEATEIATTKLGAHTHSPPLDRGSARSLGHASGTCPRKSAPHFDHNADRPHNSQNFGIVNVEVRGTRGPSVSGFRRRVRQTWAATEADTSVGCGGSGMGERESGCRSGRRHQSRDLGNLLDLSRPSSGIRRVR